jgi:hypothetical protein
MDLGGKRIRDENKDRNWIRQKLEEAFLTALAPLDNRQ